MIWLADALVIGGLSVLTIAVYGVVRFPDVYLRLQASSKAAFAGLVLLLLAGMVGADGAIVARSVLIATLLALTTPVSAHVIAQAALRHREPMRVAHPVDEREPGRRLGPVPEGRERAAGDRDDPPPE